MSTAVRSHAKINLGLGIGAPRPDGFHGLVTLYQTLEVFDRVTVSAKRTEKTSIRMSSNDRRVPVDERNTAWKMAAMALGALGIAAEVEIHIEKRLPVQGGLGAGSANAVAALIGLEAELGVRALPHLPAADVEHPGWHPGSGLAKQGWGARRLEIAAKVGSDVPLFLIGGAVLGLDRGQEVFPVPDLPETWCVIATPAVGVSTPQAFRDWDKLCAGKGLTAEVSAGTLNELSRAYASALSGDWAIDGSSGVLSGGEDLAGPQVSALVRTGIANDFEQVVFPQHPLLSEIKRTLAASGTPEAALYASLSGSGSALFGLYRGQGDAEAARARLTAMGVESLLTRTLPRLRYWREMLFR